MSFRSWGFAPGVTLAAALAAGGFTIIPRSADLLRPGNLLVLRAEEADSNTPASIVELDPNTAAQSPSNVIAGPGTGATGLRFSGSATSTGYLSHTDDRSLLTFNGANSTNTSSNVNTLNTRAVGTLDASGAYVLQTTYTGGSGNQTRSSSSLNNNTWFIGDQGCVYSDGTSKTMMVVEDAGRPDRYTGGRLGNANGKIVSVSAGTGWADPDSGFTLNTQPVVNHHNDGEIYAFHTGGAQACFADGSGRFLASSLETAICISLITRAGGEVVDSNSY